MIAYAAYEFARTRVMPDGATEGDHLKSGLEQWAKFPPAMRPKKKTADDKPAEPSLPDGLTYLWNWFIALINGCSGGGFGPPMLTWMDLQAWAVMTGNRPQLWEVDALMRLSSVFVAARSAKEK